MLEGLRRRYWLLPLAFAVAVAAVGSSAYRALERSTRELVGAELETVLEADVEALRVWVRAQQAVVRATVGDPRVVEWTRALAAIAADTAGEVPERLRAAPARAELDALLGRIALHHGFSGYRVVDPGGLQLADPVDEQVGARLRESLAPLNRALQGEFGVSHPLRLQRQTAPELAGEPVVLAYGPLRGARDEVIAVLAFAIPARDEFTEILTLARPGETGETYAFDAEGRLLSGTRFDAELAEIGLLPDADSSVVLNVALRDPGVDLTRGGVAELDARARPLTRMVADAVGGGRGVDLDGYRDFRGVTVVGAWTWLPELEMGVATEISAEEAFAGLAALRLRSFGLAALLVASAAGLFAYSAAASRLRRQAERARELGRYRIEEKIGAGGGGSVYRAHHVLLRRPTALKLVDAREASDEALARFEREAQATSRLTHPNTVAVYDYGTTPEGVFYYAMELLEGASVADCIALDGAQPEARVVHVLRQVCGSLAEAHAADLVHRDLKPSNVMLCERGGVLDFAKVLDFGMVHDARSDLELTKTSSITGTPHFLSPEAVSNPKTVDPRSDLYQLGLVAWCMLTGHHPFEGANLAELFQKQLHERPPPPSAVLGRPVDPDLEELVAACLRKAREKRPGSARELLERLDACAARLVWTQADAAAWWARWRARVAETSSGEKPPPAPGESRIDFGRRSR